MYGLKVTVASDQSLYYLRSMTSALGKSFARNVNMLVGKFLALKLKIVIVDQVLPSRIFTIEGW